MRGFLALAIALAAPGTGTSVAQTSVTPMPGLQATSPLQAGPTGSGMSQNAGPNLGLTNSTACSEANPSTAMLPTFDGGGLDIGLPATQSSTAAPGSTTTSIATPGSTSAPCNATTGLPVMTAGTTMTSSPDTTSLGVAGLGTSGLGTTGLGTAGLVSSSSASASATTSTTPTATPLASSTSSATACATDVGAMSGSAGMSAGDQIGQGASGTVADPAENLANTIPSPAQTTGGSASLPELAPPCTNTP
jgi:hypothetical protein